MRRNGDRPENLEPVARRTRRRPEHPAYKDARIAYEIGAEVRALREQRGWSQTELAKRAGMTQSAMARFEAGGTTPTLPVLERIAEALEMRLSLALAPA